MGAAGERRHGRFRP